MCIFLKYIKAARREWKTVLYYKLYSIDGSHCVILMLESYYSATRH